MYLDILWDCNISLCCQYTGEWIEVSRYPQPTQTGQCNRAKYEAINGGGISVTNRQVVNQRLATISGQAVASLDGFGKLEVTFSGKLLNCYTLTTIHTYLFSYFLY